MSFRPIQKNTFKTPGAFSWICPPDVTSIDLTMIGGGGGGGGGGAGGVGGSGIVFGSYGGGGGGASGAAGTSGEFKQLHNVAVTPGVTYSLVVGSFGQGGTAGASSGGTGGNGITGGNSTFTFPNSLVLKASGGLGGIGGNGGHAASGSTNGAGGSPVVQTAFGSAWDGSQSGLIGGTGGSHNLSTASGNTQLQIYQIFTDIGGSPAAFFSVDVTPSNTNYANAGVYGPFGELPTGIVNGNTALDIVTSGGTTLDGVKQYDTAAYSISGNNTFDGFSTTYDGGGSGGVLSLVNLIPIYFVGIDFNSFTLPIVLPHFYSTNGVGGLGDGGALLNLLSEVLGQTPNTRHTAISSSSNGISLPQSIINVAATHYFPTSGTLNVTTTAGVQTVTYTGTTSTSFTGCIGGTGTMATNNAVNYPNTGAISFWRDGTAIQIGFGAGGLGGPGGGGGTGNGLPGGSGYHGDQGLSGMVMISWS